MIKIINKKFIFIFIFTFQVNLYAFEKEDRLIAAIMGNIGKFAKGNNTDINPYTITIFKNQFNNIFDTLYKNAKINNKQVKINYIHKISDLKPSNILYIFDTSPKKLHSIFASIRGKNILTISSMKGFAQMGGMVQLYSKNQKLKIKINLHSLTKEDIKMKASLLGIARIVEGDI